MGYVHNENLIQFIPATDFQFSAGTWTPTLATYLVSMVRSAADASVTVFVPIPLPGNDDQTLGAKLVSVDIWYKIATAAADDFATVGIYKQNLLGNTVAVTGSVVDTAADTDHNTAAERLAVASHKMTVTLNTARYMDKDKGYYAVMVIDCAATTVLTFFGAQANYTLRL